MKHWNEGVHNSENWIYIGSYNFSLNNKEEKGDIYIHKNKKIYKGISVQYGNEEFQYYSSSIIYEEDVPLSLSSAILLGYGIVTNRTTKRMK